jgi:hypothetical protein
MKCARYGLIAILLSIVVLPLSAMAAPLDDLNAPIRQDGLLFSNFSASLFPTIASATPQHLSEIDVSGITVNGESGLRISAGFFAGSSQGEGSGVTLLLGFDVMALNPHQPIHSVTLTVPDFILTGQGGGSDLGAGVDVGPSSAFVGPMVVVAHSAGGGAEPVTGPASVTSALVSDARRLHVESSFGVVSDALAGIAAAGGFEVTFAQSVAEPSIVLLLVFGAGLIAATAHKVRRA